MKMKLYAIRDIKVGTYQAIITMPSVGVLMRELTDAVNAAQKDTMVAQHPEDLELFEVGDYDNETGMIEPKAPKSVVQLSELKHT